MRVLILLGILGSCAGLACSTTSGAAPVTEDASAPVADAEGTDAGAEADASTCSITTPIPMWVDMEDGFPSRIHVPASLDGKEGALLFDTGSETTFVSTPEGSKDPTPDGGTLLVGGCSRSFMGRPYASEESHDLPGIGFFGVDQILAAKRTNLDLLGGMLTRYTDGGPSTDGWLETPIEIVSNSILVRLTLDGVSVRLLVDTGSPHILWLGQKGKPGDVESKVSDALGNLISIYHGTVSAGLAAGAAETVPVDRAPTFPYFEGRIEEFGGDVQGLLGLSALGARAVVFDSARNVMLRHP